MFKNCDLFLQAITGYGMIMLDENGLIQACNNAVEVITGFEKRELYNQPFSILYTGDDPVKHRSRNELSMALQKGKFSSESWKIKKDGSRYWCVLSIAPISKAGEHVGFSVVIKDITERKQWELEVKERNDRYRLMIDGVKDYSIFMLDPTGIILTWNDGGKNIQGYSSYEVIGKHFSLFYTKEDLDSGKPERELKIAIKEGKYEEEGWRVRKNGSLFWANIIITTLYDDNNLFIGFSKVTRDLTERNSQLEMLKQSEERYKMLIGQVKDYGIFMLDEKGRIISWNEGAQRIKGYGAEEIIGKHFSIFYPEEDRRSERPAFELQVARKEGRYEEEGWRVKKDGTLFWANVVITAIFNSAGILLGFAKVTRDLTEKREQEIALQESGTKFRLLAKQLTEANRNLADTNKELEEFTTMVSHDLQEPIRTTKSFLVLLEKKLEAPIVHKEDINTYIHKAIKASDRMKALIVNLLHYAQLSQEAVHNEEINVAEMLAEVLQNLRSVIDDIGADIHIVAEVPVIRGDRIQLMQLVQNLVNNSLKFVGTNKPEITIHCRNQNDKVLFSVADNGIGIAKENQERIFEIFRRAHTTKKYPGTGIGLAICRKIVARYKGRIWVESEQGKGTTFYFTLNDNNIIL